MRRIAGNMIGVGLLLGPTAAYAHPDHLRGATSGLAHLVSDPGHLLLIGVAIASVTLAGCILWQPKGAGSKRR
jgi:hydrogenase/urease accessory protein HupE